jgi:hypothetical protein
MDRSRCRVIAGLEIDIAWRISRAPGVMVARALPFARAAQNGRLASREKMSRTFQLLVRSGEDATSSKAEVAPGNNEIRKYDPRLRDQIAVNGGKAARRHFSEK